MKPYFQEIWDFFFLNRDFFFFNFIIFFLTFLLLEDNCFTIWCWPLRYTNMSQPQGIYLSEKRKGYNYKHENYRRKESHC